MNVILILAIAGFMVMVVVSLIRGIVAFMRSTRIDLERGPDAGPSAMQLQQSRMMWARIKFQLAAVIAIVVLAAISHHS